MTKRHEEERELLNKEHIDLLKNLHEKKNNKEVNGEQKTQNKSSDSGGGKGQSSIKGKEEEEDKAKKEPSGKKKGGEGQSSSSKMKEKVKEEVKGNEIQIIHNNLLKLKKVKELQPDMEGFDLIVKVIQVIVTRHKSLQTAEGKIGDNTGVINVKVIGNKNVKHMKVGSYVKLKNARIDLVDNRMRLQPREIEQFDAGGIESIILEENDLSEREFH